MAIQNLTRAEIERAIDGGYIRYVHNWSTPMFQQRHYEAIARALREAKANALVSTRTDTLAAWETTVRTVAELFARDNNSFKQAMFYKAAGYEGVTQ